MTSPVGSVVPPATAAPPSSSGAAPSGGAASGQGSPGGPAGAGAGSGPGAQGAGPGAAGGGAGGEVAGSGSSAGSGSGGDGTASGPQTGPEGGGDKGTVSSGEAATSAISQSGSSSARNQHVREAQHIAGDVVGGHKLVFLTGGEPPVELRPVSPRLDDEVRIAFVDPPGWHDLRHRVGQSRAVILRGDAWRGRSATAIRLLQTMNTVTIFDIDPRADLTRLGTTIGELASGPASTGAAPVDGTGYLVRQPVDLTQIRGWLFDSLEHDLVRSNSRLVLTVDEGTTFDEDVQRHVVDLPAVPAAREIFVSHLRWRLGDEAADEILREAGLKSLVDGRLDADPSFDDVAHLAEVIGLEQLGAVDVERVKARIAVRRDRFDVWFDSLPDLGARTFAIALAVLDGLSYEEVTKAARFLYARLDTDRQERFEKMPRWRPRNSDPFAVTAAQRLRLVRARSTDEMVRQSVGWVPATVVQFTNRSYANRTITRAWRDYQIQDELLDWLSELSRNSSEQVQVFAGTALGLLSTLSFDYVFNRVLNPAAASASMLERRSVALALRVAAEDRRLLPVVIGLVTVWYGDSARPNHQATAALAYGLSGRLARRELDLLSSVDALDRLATVDDIDVAVAIGESLTTLVFADNLLVVPAVYETLGRWFDDQTRASTGHLAFLMLCALLITDVGDPDAPVAPTPWPTLLHLATHHPHLRAPLLTLWHRVLDEAILHNEVDNVLTSWAGFAEGDEGLRDAFVRLVRAVASYSKRTRESLARLAADWVSEERLQPLPTVSAAVAAVV
jgi:hypothetical protein